MSEYGNSEYNHEPTGESTRENVAGQVNNGVTAVKEKVSEQAGELKDKLNQQASRLGDNLTRKIDDARGKTSAGLRNTSQRIQNLASYVEEHDARDMSDAVARSSREIVRQHPGKSLLAGLIVGVILGRLFSIRTH